MGAVEKLAAGADFHHDVVLALTQSGREELKRPRAGLSLPQRRLLTLIDGGRSVRDIVAAERALHAERTTRDAARLLGHGLVELEQGWLEPITRPTTVMPVTAPPAGPTASPQVRSLLVAAPAAQVAAAGTAVPQRRRGALLGVLLAGGSAVAVAVAYLLQPEAPGMSPAAATSWAPQPILNAPAAAVASPAAATAQRSSETPRERAAPTGAVAPTDPAPAQAAPSGTAQQSLGAAPPRSDRVLAPSTVARNTASSPVAPNPAGVAGVNRPSAAVAAPAAPTPANSDAPASATGSGDAPAARVATTEATAPGQAEVPAWAREFAPVSPEADSTPVAAASSTLSPIERVPPIYPREAARAGITRGRIRALAVLTANGSVERVEFPSTDAANRVFERPGRAALMTWTFPQGERGRLYEVVLDFVAP